MNLKLRRVADSGDRTAAYLASGKPVVVQDTGFSEILPCGEGLFAFRDESRCVRRGRDD